MFLFPAWKEMKGRLRWICENFVSAAMGVERRRRRRVESLWRAAAWQGALAGGCMASEGVTVQRWEGFRVVWLK